jgi:hypothetical protein
VRGDTDREREMLVVCQVAPQSRQCQVRKPVFQFATNSEYRVLTLYHRNELFVTAGANKSLSFYREASGT